MCQGEPQQARSVFIFAQAHADRDCGHGGIIGQRLGGAQHDFRIDRIHTHRLVGGETEINFAGPHMQGRPRRQQCSADHALGAADDADVAVVAFVRVAAALRDQRGCAFAGQQFAARFG